ncbi:MAG: bifunctional nicotinamidase/pyrazinamidase [Candidatus Kariarchaeaceae archaeon]|jgi:nicotinamidase/pyrazinamidase
MEVQWISSTSITNKDALLVVDIQNDFLEGGALEVMGGNEIIGDVNRLGNLFKNKGARIIYTQDWHPSDHYSFASSHSEKQPFDPISGVNGIGPVVWPDHCVQGTNGAQFHSDLDESLPHLIIRKGYHRKIDSYSALLENDMKTETGLTGYLESLGIQRIFVCGLALDFCVRYSAQDARKKGYDVFILHDLTRGIAESSVNESMKSMHEQGIKFIISNNVS